jgi:heme exporter protein C
MSNPAGDDKRGLLIGLALGCLLLGHWLAAFLYAPPDEHQGEVYRIMFLHVPCAFTAFASSAALALFSIAGLKRRTEATLTWARATAEVGLLFTCLTLATGSIWGRPTWGTWWTWDARLTTTLLLALLYAGYLLLYTSMAPGPGRIRACAVLGIIIAADVPIIYESVNWWRTLHQPQSILREGGPKMAPEILSVLLAGFPVMMAFAAWLIAQRRKNIQLKDEVEAASFEQVRA